MKQWKRQLFRGVLVDLWIFLIKHLCNWPYESSSVHLLRLFVCDTFFSIGSLLFSDFWTHGFSQEGPIIQLCPSVHPFVRPFLPNADISGSVGQKFLIFCTKLEQHKCRKVMFSNFPKRLLTPCGWGQKVKLGPKLNFFKDCFRTAPQNFLIFCMKLDNNKAFQTMYMLSLGILLPRPSRSKGQILGPKLTFSVVAVGPVVHCPLFLYDIRVQETQ